MRVTGNQALAVVSALFFVALFGYMWSVERREPSPIVAALPAVVETPPAKRVEPQEMVTDLFAGKPRDDGEDSFTAATRDGFLRTSRIAAERAAQKAAVAENAPASPQDSAPQTAASAPAAGPTTSTPVVTVPNVVPASPVETPDSRRTELLATSARRIERLCMRVKSDDGSSAPELRVLKTVAADEPSYAGPVWDAVLSESQKALTYYGADTNGMWKGLAANDYMVRISATALKTCGSLRLSSIIFEAIDPTASLIDQKALDRFIDDALQALD